MVHLDHIPGVDVHEVIEAKAPVAVARVAHQPSEGDVAGAEPPLHGAPAVILERGLEEQPVEVVGGAVADVVVAVRHAPEARLVVGGVGVGVVGAWDGAAAIRPVPGVGAESDIVLESIVHLVAVLHVVARAPHIVQDVLLEHGEVRAMHHHATLHGRLHHVAAQVAARTRLEQVHVHAVLAQDAALPALLKAHVVQVEAASVHEHRVQPHGALGAL